MGFFGKVREVCRPVQRRDTVISRCFMYCAAQVGIAGCTISGRITMEAKCPLNGKNIDQYWESVPGIMSEHTAKKWTLNRPTCGKFSLC